MESLGTLPDGRTARVFTLTNENGLRARVSDLGAILLSMEAPDRQGRIADITLGYDRFDDWLANPFYLGATIGRFGNRIRGGRFTLDGREYRLATNNAPGGLPCHLHGGVRGFNHHLWNAEPAADGRSVSFTLASPDGDEGYPGTLSVRVTYTLDEEDGLLWEATATTDAPTIVNLVNHTYWNLSGDPSTTILDHKLQLEADDFLPTDAGLIPTGERRRVACTPMDFTHPTTIGDRIDAEDEALAFGAGYDHAWVLRGPAGELRPAALVHDPLSGRVMELFTDQPAVQFYAGNFLDNITPGKGGYPILRRGGLCLETEGFPDAPNRPDFPSAVLRPGETYRHRMLHRFGLK